MRISEYLRIGEKIKTARKRSGYSQRAMATELGLSFSAYSNYENSYSEPSMEVIEQFCGITNMEVSELFELKLDNYKVTSVKTFAELISVLIDLDRRGFSIEANTTYTQAENQLIAHLTLDIPNAQLATFIPDWNNANEKLRSGLMSEDKYKMWLDDTLKMFNVSIDEYL